MDHFKIIIKILEIIINVEAQKFKFVVPFPLLIGANFGFWVEEFSYRDNLGFVNVRCESGDFPKRFNIFDAGSKKELDSLYHQ